MTPVTSLHQMLPLHLNMRATSFEKTFWQKTVISFETAK